VEKAKSLFSIEMKVLCKVLVKDSSGDELMACADESNSDQEDQSAESVSGNNDGKTQTDQHDSSRQLQTKFPTVSLMTAMAACEFTKL
jgi:hypothetical protein